VATLALGAQHVSNKESASHVRFGTSSREQQEKVYLTAVGLTVCP
jgi:hypothetical protein